MKKILVAAFAIFIGLSAIPCLGQKSNDFLKVDYSEIKKFVTQNDADFKALMDRFVSADTTLTLDELKYVFYGVHYAPEYDYNDLSGDTRTLIKEEKYEDALQKCREELKNSPSSMEILFYAWLCAKELDDLEAETVYNTRLSMLLDLVFATGDGQSAQTALKIMEVSDEYLIIYAVFGANVKKQALVGLCDVMTLYEDDPEQTVDVYFDITLHMENLNKLFGKSSKPKKPAKKSKKAKASAQIVFDE